MTEKNYCNHINCSPVEILARTIYGEARGEDLKGKEAIACIVLNRVKKAKENGGVFWWGNTIETICLKKWQFSCWNKDDPNYNKLISVTEENAVFAICKRIAKKAVCGLLKDFTFNSTHYHTKNISPNWSKGKAPICEIGNHYFYNNIN